MKNKNLLLLTGALLLLAMTASTLQAADARAKKKKARKPNPAMAVIKDVPGLPRGLKGKANVHRPRTNCGPTITGLKQIDKWLGDGKWDVIHFNWGLHDLKYMGPNGENLVPKGKRRTSTSPARRI
jgi:hypothetical protein